MSCPPPLGDVEVPTRFDVGDRVRIDDRDPSVHHRVPAYVRGHEGVVVLVAHRYGRPESLAYGGSGEPSEPLYRVRLVQTDLWPDDATPGDTLDVEIFQHWLSPANGATTRITRAAGSRMAR